MSDGQTGFVAPHNHRDVGRRVAHRRARWGHLETVLVCHPSARVLEVAAVAAASAIDWFKTDDRCPKDKMYFLDKEWYESRPPAA